MSEVVHIAPPRSRANIEELADAVRTAIEHQNVCFFPVVPFLETCLDRLAEGFTYEICERAEMGDRMGAVDPINRVLMVRADVYEMACNHHPRARFTIAHEFGHTIMHIGTLNRAESELHIPAYKDPEWQADYFAAALLMPRRLAVRFSSVDEMMRMFGVSRQAADGRVRRLGLAL